MFGHTTQRRGPATRISRRTLRRKAAGRVGSSPVPELTWIRRGSGGRCPSRARRSRTASAAMRARL